MTKTKRHTLTIQINGLTDQLNSENKRFYDDFLVFTRIKAFLYDDTLIETQLLQILQDILDAQNDGISAETYFGNTPQQTAAAILAEMPRPNYKPIFKWAGYIFLLSSLYTFLSQLSDLNNHIRVGSFFN